MKAKESNFGKLIKWLNEFGWEKGIAILERQHLLTEAMQASLYADPETIKQAQKLCGTIVKQGITLIRLREMMKEKTSLTPQTPLL